MSTTGTRDAIVIFAKFAHEHPELTQAPAWSADFFDPEKPGSFSHFYNTMSFGRLRVTGEVAPTWYSSRRPASAYLAPTHTEPGDVGEFSLEILQQADGDIDFSRFDNDGPDGIPSSGDDDGVVDALFLIVPSTPPNFLLGPATGIASLGLESEFVTDDLGSDGPIRIASFRGTVQQGRTLSEAVGTTAHEFGHLLGLPDLFDTRFVRSPVPLPPERDSAGIGAWGLMGWGALGWNRNDGPTSFSAWSRAKLGWARVQRPTQTQQEAALADVGLHGDVLEIPLGTQERFVLEYRRRSSSFYDRNIPEEGVLIWHFGRQGDPPALGLDLESADGRWRDAGATAGTVPDPINGEDNLDFWAHDTQYAVLHAGNLGDAGDPFGREFRQFTPETNPSSLSADRSRSIHVEDIRLDGDSARVRITTVPPQLKLAFPRLIDSNGDFLLSPGEEVEVTVQIGNDGGLPARDVRLAISSPDSLITVERATADFGILDVGRWSTSTGVRLPSLSVGNFEGQTEIRIDLRVSATGAVPIDTFLVAPAAASYRLAGRVVSPSGEPVAGVRISAGSGILSYQVETADDGSFNTSVIPGRYTLSITPPSGNSYAFQFQIVTVNRDVEVEISLEETVRLVGTVRDTAGAPLRGVRIRAGGFASAVSDSLGRFEIRVLRGPRRIEFDPPAALERLGIPRSGQTIELTRDTEREFVLAAGIQVEFVIRDADGQPLGAGFWFVDPSASFFERTVNGRGTLTLPRGIYEIIVDQPPSGFGPFGTLVELGSDTTIVAQLRRMTRVHGRLADTAARPAFLQEVAFDGTENRALQPELQQDGTFVAMLAPGRHTARLRTDGTGTSPSQILDTLDVGETELEVELTPRDGLEVSGVLLDAAGRPAPDVTLRFVSADAGAWSRILTGPDGRFLTSLLPGEYEIETIDGTQLQRQAARQLPQIEPLVLRLQGGDPITGVVEIAAGSSSNSLMVVLLVEDPLKPSVLKRLRLSDRLVLVGPPAQVAALVGPEGTFELPAGPQHRWLLALPALASGAGTAVPLDPSRPSHADLTVRMPSASDTLFGFVRGEDGSTPEAAVLRFFDEATGVVAQTKTRSLSGSYRIVLPSGVYRVRAALWDTDLGLTTHFDLGSVRVAGQRRLDLVLQAVLTAVQESRQSPLPGVPRLGNSYPNPFNGTAVMAYALPHDGDVSLVIYNLLGQRVKIVVRERRPAGRHLARWDGYDDAGRPLASGVYLYVLEAARQRITRKLLLLR